MRLSTVSMKKCLLCGEGTPPKRKGREDPLLAAWDEETISTLVSVLFNAAEGKEVVENLLRTGGYCGPCRLLLRDLSLTHKIISNGRRQMAKVVETIVQNVSTHLEKVSQPRKKQGKFAESVFTLFKELQKEDWTQQSFEYIESAVLKSFVKEEESFIINPLPDLPTEEVDKNVTSFQDIIVFKEEVQEFGNEEMEPFGGMDFPLLEGESSAQNELTNSSVDVQTGSLMKVDIKENQDKQSFENDGDPADCGGDSDYVPTPHESDDSDCQTTANTKVESEDEDYNPPAPKRRVTRNIFKKPSEVVNKANSVPMRKRKEDLTSKKRSAKTSKRRRVKKPKSSLPAVESLKRKYKSRLSEEKLQKSLEEFPLPCRHDKCNRRFRSEPRMEGHFNKYHLGDRITPYRCSFCKKDDETSPEAVVVGFVDFTKLQRHLRASHNEVFPCDKFFEHKCPHCGKYFRLLSELNAHVASKHEKKSLYGTCDVCRKRFDTIEEMEAHKSKFHQGQYPFTCEDCNQIFADGVALRFHVKQLHSLQDRIMCTICTDKSFATKERLQYHEYANHPELRGAKFQCKVCDLTFKNYYYLRDHRMDFHRETLKIPQIYKCEECNITYKRLNQLQSHQSTMHSSNRKKTFKCSICPKAFVCVSSLKGHEEVHSGLKYICFICATQVSGQGQLTRHMKYVHPDLSDGSDPPKRTSKPSKGSNKTAKPNCSKIQSICSGDDDDTTKEGPPTPIDTVLPDAVEESTANVSVLNTIPE